MSIYALCCHSAIQFKAVTWSRGLETLGTALPWGAQPQVGHLPRPSRHRSATPATPVFVTFFSCSNQCSTAVRARCFAILHIRKSPVLDNDSGCVGPRLPQPPPRKLSGEHLPAPGTGGYTSPTAAPGLTLAASRGLSTQLSSGLDPPLSGVHEGLRRTRVSGDERRAPTVRTLCGPRACIHSCAVCAHTHVVSGAPGAAVREQRVLEIAPCALGAAVSPLDSRDGEGSAATWCVASLPPHNSILTAPSSQLHPHSPILTAPSSQLRLHSSLSVVDPAPTLPSRRERTP